MPSIRLSKEATKIPVEIKAALKNRFNSIKKMTHSFIPYKVSTKRPTNYQLYPTLLSSVPPMTKTTQEEMDAFPSAPVIQASPQKHIVAERIKAVQQITLNRPEAMNALSSAMVDEVSHHVNTAKRSSSVTCIFIRSSTACSKQRPVFCAGGDVKALATGRSQPKEQIGFMRREFQLNYNLATLRKETVAFPGGLVMGGGAGLSLHCRWKVGTLRSEFSMPECRIGWFPDVGSTFLLSRLPYALGMWMGLTGSALKGWDLYNLGILTNIVSEDCDEHLRNELVSAAANGFNLKSVLQHHSLPYCTDSFTSQTLSNYCMISRVFGKGSLQEIFDKLEFIISSKDRYSSSEYQWAADTLATLKEHSPLSLRVTFDLLQRAKGSSFRQCILNEFNAACGMLKMEDFYSGVTERLIQKSTKRPAWSNSSIQAIPSQTIHSILTASNSLSDSEKIVLSPTDDFTAYPYAHYSLPNIADIEKFISQNNYSSSIEDVIQRVAQNFVLQCEMPGFLHFIENVVKFHVHKVSNRWVFNWDPQHEAIKSKI